MTESPSSEGMDLEGRSNSRPQDSGFTLEYDPQLLNDELLLRTRAGETTRLEVLNQCAQQVALDMTTLSTSNILSRNVCAER